MMPVEFDKFLLFVAASLALNLTPGPDLLYVAGRSISQGRLAGIVSALGIGAGCIVHMAAAAFGLSAILNYSATAFVVVKIGGGLYLLYLAYTTLRSGEFGQSDAGTGRDNRKLPQLFWQGAITNILNPKVALFFLAFLPQFVDPTHGSAVLQIIFLGSYFIVQGTIVTALVGLAFGLAGGWLSRRPAFWKWQRRLTASILASLGLRLLLMRND